MSKLLELEEAQQRLLSLAPQMPIKRVEAKDAVGRYLAEDVIAARTQPPADLSAMDGYAIAGDGPWQNVGESRAGEPYPGALSNGEAVRISTGAHMPQGSDRVLIQENAVLQGTNLSASDTPPAGRHVRKHGFDFEQGQTVLNTGTRIGPGQLALILSAGHANVAIHETPKVAVLDSGDELAKDPTECGPDQIPASNGAMIGAMLSSLGCEVARIGPVPDDREALATALSDAEDCDILVTSGGASVGDHDLIQPALEEWGAEIDFWKAAIKPGKPLMVAKRKQGERRQVILGLPGNPVSSFVTCFLFALPLARAIMGDRNPLPLRCTAVAAADLPAVGTRLEFLRGVWDGRQARLAASQDSSALAALAASNCLIERPANARAVKAGEQIAIYPL